MAESFDLGDAPVSTETAEVSVDSTPETVSETPDTSAVADSPPDNGVNYEPSWLDELSGLMDNPQQQVIPQAPPGYPGNYPQQYYQQPQQYYQPPQQQQAPPVTPQDIDYLLDNPRGYIQSIANQSAEQARAYAANVERQVSQIMRNSAAEAYGNARGTIEKGYREVFNKDNSYRGNENVRRMVDGTLQKMMGSVQQAIASGNFRAAQVFQDPSFFPTLLYAAKMKAGAGFSGQQAARPAGATMEGVTPPVHRESGPRLDSDLQGVADALGPAFEKELKKQLAEAEKRGDLVW